MVKILDKDGKVIRVEQQSIYSRRERPSASGTGTTTVYYDNMYREATFNYKGEKEVKSIRKDNETAGALELGSMIGKSENRYG